MPNENAKKAVARAKELSELVLNPEISERIKEHPALKAELMETLERTFNTLESGQSPFRR